MPHKIINFMFYIDFLKINNMSYAAHSVIIVYFQKKGVELSKQVKWLNTQLRT